MRRWRQVAGAYGERGLANTARTVNQYSAGTCLGRTRIGNDGELRLGTNEDRWRGQRGMEWGRWHGRRSHDDVAVHIASHADTTHASGHTVVQCHTAAAGILDGQLSAFATLLGPVYRGKLQGMQHKG